MCAGDSRPALQSSLSTYIYIFFSGRSAPSLKFAFPLWSPLRGLGSPRDLWRGETKLRELIRGGLFEWGAVLRALLVTCARALAPGKSVIAQDILRQLSTIQIPALTRATPAIYLSYLPHRRNYAAYTAHRTRTPIYKNAQHAAAHATIDVRSRHRPNPLSTRFVLDKASECRRRPPSYHVDPLSRRQEVAHGVLRSSPKPEQKFFFA